jgi:pimeloyl-ACP methyl ester carboxylesterase
LPLPAEATERFVTTNGVRLHVVEAGPASGRPVLLLHGFPEFWYGWRKQIGPLAEAGFRLIVPDQRGYNTSDRPGAVSDYRLEELGRDALGLLDEAGHERALVVGHDWGGVVAWWLALAHPERVERLAILNVPHPRVMRRFLRGSPRQLVRSWYIFFFQIPRLPEWWLARDGFRHGTAALRRAGGREAFTGEDLARYKEAWGQPGALTGMVNWYRAAARSLSQPLPGKRVRVPTLLLWGARDVALGREMAEPSVALCDEGRLVFLEEASHFAQHDEAERVNEELIRFLRG